MKAPCGLPPASIVPCVPSHQRQAEEHALVVAAEADARAAGPGEDLRADLAADVETRAVGARHDDLVVVAPGVTVGAGSSSDASASPTEVNGRNADLAGRRALRRTIRRAGCDNDERGLAAHEIREEEVGDPPLALGHRTERRPLPEPTHSRQ